MGYGGIQIGVRIRKPRRALVVKIGQRSPTKDRRSFPIDRKSSIRKARDDFCYSVGQVERVLPTQP